MSQIGPDPTASVASGQMTAAAMIRAIEDHEQAMIEAFQGLKEQSAVLAEIADVVIRSLRNGQKVLLAGNGGSAAESQHFSAELVGRFRRERRPYAAVALTTDSSILTAIGNDYSYDDVFARQVEALGRPGDVLIVFSTSGRSSNLLRAAVSARELGMTVIAATGSRPNALADSADLVYRAPGGDTATVQEFHMMFTHLVCEQIESVLARES